MFLSEKQKCSLIFTGLFTRLRSVASVNRVAIYGLPEGSAGTFRARRLEIL